MTSTNEDLIAELRAVRIYVGEMDDPIRTLHLRAAEALERAEAKLAAIQDLIPVGVAIHDEMYDALMAINKLFWSDNE